MSSAHSTLLFRKRLRPCLYYCSISRAMSPLSGDGGPDGGDSGSHQGRVKVLLSIHQLPYYYESIQEVRAIGCRPCA